MINIAAAFMTVGTLSTTPTTEVPRAVPVERVDREVLPPQPRESTPTPSRVTTSTLFPQAVPLTSRGIWGTIEDIVRGTPIEGIAHRFQTDLITDGLRNAYVQELKANNPTINPDALPAGTVLNLNYFNQHPEIVSDLVARAQAISPDSDEAKNLIRERLRNQIRAQTTK